MPDDHGRLLGRVARLYYDHGLTHAQIAELQGLSRVKITRLLAEARASGVVEITVHSDARPFADLEQRLARELGLSSAWVAPPPTGDREHDQASLGVTGADCLAALLPGVRSVAVGLSLAVASSVEHLRATPATDLQVLPLAGSRGGPSSVANPHELALRLATRFGGRAHHLPAPLVASSAATARALREDLAVTETLAAAAAADALVVGVGGTSSPSRTLLQSVTTADFAALRDHGAVGDVSARFFDAAGQPLPSDVDDRVVGLDLAAMRRVPLRIGVAGGAEKLDAVEVAVRTGLLTVLVTDRATASALLARSAPAG